MPDAAALDAITDFLPCATPTAWLEAAVAHPEELLIDHANCEKKAASTALGLLYRYTGEVRCCSVCRGWRARSCATSSRWWR